MWSASVKLIGWRENSGINADRQATKTGSFSPNPQTKLHLPSCRGTSEVQSLRMSVSASGQCCSCTWKEQPRGEKSIGLPANAHSHSPFCCYVSVGGTPTQFPLRCHSRKLLNVLDTVHPPSHIQSVTNKVLCDLPPNHPHPSLYLNPKSSETCSMSPNRDQNLPQVLGQ